MAQGGVSPAVVVHRFLRPRLSRQNSLDSLILSCFPEAIDQVLRRTRQESRIRPRKLAAACSLGHAARHLPGPMHYAQHRVHTFRRRCFLINPSDGRRFSDASEIHPFGNSSVGTRALASAADHHSDATPMPLRGDAVAWGARADLLETWPTRRTIACTCSPTSIAGVGQWVLKRRSKP